MKTVLVTMVLCLLVGGCVSAKYNPKSGEVSYFRAGDQELGGVEVILSDGSSISFEKQKSEGQALVEAIRVIGGLVK